MSLPIVPGPDNTLVTQSAVLPFTEVDPTIAVQLITASLVIPTLTYDPYNFIYVCDATSGSINVTLPYSTGNAAFYFKKIDSSGNAVIISTVSASIDGGTTASLAAQYNSLRVVSYTSASWIKL